MHDPTPDEDRLANGDTILLTLPGRKNNPHKLLNLHKLHTLAGPVDLDIQVIRTINAPHIIRHWQPASSSSGSAGVRAEILLSHDDLTDANALLRDRQMSGHQLTTPGWYSSLYTEIWELNIPVLQWHTVYKLAMVNTAPTTIRFDCNLTIQML